MLKDMVISKELLEKLYMMLEEEHLSLKFNSEILIDIKLLLKISSLPKECILDNSFIVVLKPLLQLVMYFPLTKFLKEH